MYLIVDLVYNIQAYSNLIFFKYNFIYIAIIKKNYQKFVQVCSFGTYYRYNSGFHSFESLEKEFLSEGFFRCDPFNIKEFDYEWLISNA